jgi:hypothetical protein
MMSGPPLASTQLPPEPIEWLLESVSFETSLAPALAFLAGVLLTLSPISWPGIPAVMTVLTPAARAGTADALDPNGVRSDSHWVEGAAHSSCSDSSLAWTALSPRSERWQCP